MLCFNGDGVGPEIVGAARTVIQAAGVDIDWVDMAMVPPPIVSLTCLNIHPYYHNLLIPRTPVSKPFDFFNL